MRAYSYQPITATLLNFSLGRVLSAVFIVPIEVSWAQHHRLVSKRGRNSFNGAMYFYGAHESLLVPNKDEYNLANCELVVFL